MFNNQFLTVKFKSLFERKKSSIYIPPLTSLGMLNDEQKKVVDSLVIKANADKPSSLTIDAAVPIVRNVYDDPIAAAMLRKYGLEEAAKAAYKYLKPIGPPVPIDPATNKPVPHAPTIEELDALIEGQKGKGDVTIDTKALANFGKDPGVRSVFAILDSLQSFKGVPSIDLERCFLTLSRAECSWEPGQVHSSGAAGPLQIKPATYRIAVDMFNKVAATNATVQTTVRKIDAYFHSLQMAGYPVKPFNYTDPSNDSTQYKAMVGHLLFMVNLALTEWTYSPNHGWLAVKPNPATRDFVTRFGGYMNSLASGLQMLMTAYGHGYYVFSRAEAKVRPHNFRYPSRFKRDYDVYTSLAKVKDFSNAVARIPSLPLGDVASFNPTDPIIAATSSQYGDITIPTAIALSDNVILFNNYIIDRLKLKGNHLNAPLGNAHKTSNFGWRTIIFKGKRKSGNHEGVDLRAQTPVPVYAVDSGVVVRTDISTLVPSYGKMILLKANDGSGFRYAHLSKLLVSAGHRVMKGQIIGMSGNTGTADFHLHFEYFNPNNMGSNLKPEVESDPLSDPKSRWKLAVNNIT